MLVNLQNKGIKEMFKMRLLMLSVLLAVSTGCEAQNASTPITVDAILEENGAQQLPLQLEVMQTPSDRQKGMMFREELKEGLGMLFVWPKAEERIFWMRNTYVPLDMVFIKGEKIIGFVENATPLTDTPRTPKGNKPADKVIELPAGYIAKYHITTAWQLKIKDTSKLKPQASIR